MTERSGYSRCTGAGCGALILWATTVGGREMPLDPAPADDGTVLLTRQDDERVRAQVLTGADLPAEGRLVYRPHHRTCPDSEQFRRRRPSQGPRCAECGQPMSTWLSDHGYRAHIGCLPPISLADAIAAERARAMPP